MSLQIFLKIFCDSPKQEFFITLSDVVYIQDHSEMSFDKLDCEFANLLRKFRNRMSWGTNVMLYVTSAVPASYKPKLACKRNRTQ